MEDRSTSGGLARPSRRGFLAASAGAGALAAAACSTSAGTTPAPAPPTAGFVDNGTNPQAKDVARQMVQTQTPEVARMQQLQGMPG